MALKFGVTGVKKTLFHSKQNGVITITLPGGGKTQLVRVIVQFFQLRNLTTMPTVGFNVETFTHGRKAPGSDGDFQGWGRPAVKGHPLQNQHFFR